MKKEIEKEFIASYEANKNALFKHILFRIGGDREKAIDMLSDIFTRTWDAMAKGKEIENLRAYFYRVAHNLIVDEYAKPKIASLDALNESQIGEQESDDARELNIADMSAHNDVMKNSEVSELHRALNKLEESDRDVLVMRYVSDLGPNEIAEILGVSANVISVRINRASKALREILNPS